MIKVDKKLKRFFQDDTGYGNGLEIESFLAGIDHKGSL